jgi:hypothetical protein
VLKYKIGDWYILTDKEIDDIYRISHKKRNEVFYLIGQILTIKSDSIIIKFKELTRKIIFVFGKLLSFSNRK